MPRPSDPPVSLRERKKQETRRTLTETALRLFEADGFDAVTLDRLTAEAGIARRTFFRYFDTKEDLALAAEQELWDAYLAEFRNTEADSGVIEALHQAMLTAITGRDTEWERRFVATRRLIAHNPTLPQHSSTLSLRTQQALVEILEERTGTDGRTDVRLRLAPELAMAAWRCGAKNWVRVERHSPRRGHRARATLITRIDEAFAALPATLDLTLRTSDADRD